MSLQHSNLRILVSVLSLTAMVPLSGCNLSFFVCAFGSDAAQTLGVDGSCPEFTDPGRTPPEPGTLQGQVFSGDDPAAHARIEVLGLDQTRFTDDDGRFALTDLTAGPIVLRITHDSDSDLMADEGALAGAEIKLEAHANGVLDSAEKLTGYDFGEIALESLGTLSGQVTLGANNDTPQAAGVHVRVLATRPACVPQAGVDEDGDAVAAQAVLDARCADIDYSDDAFFTVDLPAESIAGADAQGDFTLREVLGGRVLLVAVAETIDSTGTTAIVGASAPVEVADAADAGTVTLHIDDIQAMQTDTRRVRQFAINGEIRGGAFFRYVPSGRPPLACDVRPPSGLDQPGAPHVCDSEMPWVCAGPNEVISNDSGALATPVGLYDVTFCTGPVSATFSRVVTGSGAPYADNARIVASPLVDAGQRCALLSGANDCDGDGLKALPPLRDSDDYTRDRQIWEDCASTCAGNLNTITAIGEDGVASCDVGNETFDCDDDADLQPDVSEAPDCVGPGAGTDKDGDLLCDGFDPFPWCEDNDANCNGSVRGVPPGVPDEVQNFTFCATFSLDGDSDDYCAADASAPDCLGDYRLSCTEDNCFAAADCDDAGDICHETVVDGPKRCRTPCTLQAECDVGETCDGTVCVPAVEADVQWCFCEDAANPGNTLSFFDVPAQPGGQCDAVEAAPLWELCRGLWMP